MRLGFRCLVTVVGVVGVVLLSGFAAIVASSPAVSPAGDPIVPRSSGSSPKMHLIEGFTGTWCTWCSVFDPAISRYTQERSDVVFLAYHGPPGSDPFGDLTVVNVRGTSSGANAPASGNPFYTVPGWPTTVFDGAGPTFGNDNPLYIVGAYRWSPETYDAISSAIGTSDTTSNIAITITGDLTPTGANVAVAITATDPVPQSNLYVRIVLYEDQLYFPQTTRPDGQRGVGFHENVARALNEQTLTIMMGQTVTKTATFPFGPGWDLNKLGVAAFVQSNTKRGPFTISPYSNQFYFSDVLNAAKHDFTPRTIMLYRDLGTAADYGGVYEELLARAGERFEVWNTYTPGMDTGISDPRDLPTAADLAETPALMWMTGARTAPVLTQASRDLMTAHLGGTGDLLIGGSGLGADGWINYRPWYQSTLHAQYNSDDTGQTTVQGVSGNPIGGGFSSFTLNLVSASSPDRIDAFGPGAAVPFQYPAGPLPGSVNAQHDLDSRIVYLGFRYFENTADTNRMSVVNAIFDWLDGAYAPTASMVYPTGGEQFAQGANVDLQWLATDVRIPQDGIELYFSDNYPTGTWQLIAGGEPNDGLYMGWTVPMVDSSTCRIKVVVRDSTMNPPTEAMSGDFICGTPAPPVFSLTFTGADLGWHFISFPTDVSDMSRASVLSSITGSYGTVRVYDPLSADPWVTYDASKPSSRLQTLDNTQGFWILITQPCVFAPAGNWPTAPTTITLYQGWNMVGFPSRQGAYTVGDLKAATGATRVEAFDAAAGPYYLTVPSDTARLQYGNGYWVYMPSSGTWIVPA
jgi:hypothetical protein